MLRKLFGGGGDDPPPRAENPWELNKGDFVKFGFTAPAGLSAEEFQIVSVHALDLGGPHKIRRVLVAEEGGGNQFLMWKSEDGQLAVGREILRPVVEQIFDIDDFGAIFDPETPPSHTLERKAQLPELEGWTATVYRQEAAQEAYRHMVDPETAMIGQSLTDDAEGLDFYRVVGDQRKFALEAYVFDGGKTDVILIAHLSDTAIEEIWQG